ncbi:MAG: C45 family peptidase [Acidimicrobiia bacterium]|nr:C45 family peptidase [Acidimicrobiia bacterium]
MTKLTVLRTSGRPAEVGAAHGSAFATEIREYLSSRIELSREGTDLSTADVVAIADTMVDAHHDYDTEIFDEMVAMADAAGISPGEAVIVGGYTDFIDTVRAVAKGTAVEDTCTSVITPDAKSGGNGFLAQTWDMNASATPHVFMLDVSPNNAPRALVFTTHGALGQIGMNKAGIAVGINNLTVTDGAVGVTWPFVVRKALRQMTFDAALACITDAKLAGGHNFLLFDRFGRGASIEATTTRTVIEDLGTESLVHTNHCLFPETQQVEAERPPDLDENSKRRLKDATAMVENNAVHTVGSLMALFRDEGSVCRRPEPPFNYESSGAVIMRPGTLDLWACWGLPSENEFEHFSLT